MRLFNFIILVLGLLTFFVMHPMLPVNNDVPALVQDSGSFSVLPKRDIIDDCRISSW